MRAMNDQANITAYHHTGQGAPPGAATGWAREAEPAEPGAKRPASGFRRIVAGVALLAWPVLEFLAFVTSPPGATHDPVIFREQDTKVQLSALLYLWATMAIIPTVLGLSHLLRSRLPRLSEIGAAIGLLGAAHALTLFTTDFYDLALAHELAPAQAEQVTARANDLWGFVYGMLLPGFLTHVGLYILLIGAAVARVLPWWAVPVALAGTIVPFLTVELSPLVQAIGALPHILVYGMLGLRVLRMSNDEWRYVAE